MSCVLFAPSDNTKRTCSHATTFSITRRRSVVPLHKRLESHLARLQVLTTGSHPKHDPLGSNSSLPSTIGGGGSGFATTQLVAFLDDFPLGRCMTFTVRGTDALETSARSGKHLVRFIDAKFAIPGVVLSNTGASIERADEGKASVGRGSAGGSEYVCLDVLEYATEHDDIFVGFDSEEGLSRCVVSSFRRRWSVLIKGCRTRHVPSGTAGNCHERVAHGLIAEMRRRRRPHLTISQRSTAG